LRSKLKLHDLARFSAPVRLVLFLLGVLLLWLPIAAPIALLVADANTATIATMTLLFVEFLVLIRYWGKRVHGDTRIFQTYGWVRSPQAGQELLTGLVIGLTCLGLMFGVQGQLGWVEWQPVAFISLFRVMLAGLLTGIATGLAEELVFRGWILDELERDYSARMSLWVSSFIFAGLHFIKPIAEIIRTFPQFPGLLLLGLSLVWAKRSTRDLRSPHGRLGLSIGLHAGLVWGYYMIQVGGLATYSPNVPEWLTGIDKNPLAGAVGLIFLTVLAGLMQWRSKLNQKAH